MKKFVLGIFVGFVLSSPFVQASEGITDFNKKYLSDKMVDELDAEITAQEEFIDALDDIVERGSLKYAATPLGAVVVWKNGKMLIRALGKTGGMAFAGAAAATKAATARLKERRERISAEKAAQQAQKEADAKAAEEQKKAAGEAAAKKEEAKPADSDKKPASADSDNGKSSGKQLAAKASGNGLMTTAGNNPPPAPAAAASAASTTGDAAATTEGAKSADADAEAKPKKDGILKRTGGVAKGAVVAVGSSIKKGAGFVKQKVGLLKPKKGSITEGAKRGFSLAKVGTKATFFSSLRVAWALFGVAALYYGVDAFYNQSDRISNLVETYRQIPGARTFVSISFKESFELDTEQVLSEWKDDFFFQQDLDSLIFLFSIGDLREMRDNLQRVLESNRAALERIEDIRLEYRQE